MAMAFLGRPALQGTSTSDIQGSMNVAMTGSHRATCTSDGLGCSQASCPTRHSKESGRIVLDSRP